MVRDSKEKRCGGARGVMMYIDWVGKPSSKINKNNKLSIIVPELSSKK